jgi:hypothetical protein
MSSTAVGEADLVGLSAVLYTLHTHGHLPHRELVEVCTSYGLRAGAVSWDSAIKLAVYMRLVTVTGGRVSITQTGGSMVALVAADMEPSEEFAQAILTFSIGRSSSRFALAQANLVGIAIQDPQGTATPLLEDLVDVGLLAPTGTGDWAIQASEFNPLMVGLLLSTPKGTLITSEVGSLGERLTLEYYREQGWDPLHVSPISDSYGFDVLCRHLTGGAPPTESMAVEAKGTTTTGPYRFYASRHELRVAKQLGQRYEIALWGEIDPAASLPDNYVRLRARGFPRTIRDPYGHVETHAPGLLSGRSILGGLISADGVVWQHA